MNKMKVTRRTFVTGLTLGGLTAGLGLRSSQLLATPRAPTQQPDVLTGQNFSLKISEQAVNFTGKERTATTVNNSLPAPILRFKEGERVTLHVANALTETSSIHWHGLILPTDMDGVPGLSFDGIPSNGSYTYEFDVKQSGTYWYHSHSGYQEQTGIYGAIIIDPIEPEPFSFDREFVMLLSDWSDEDPHQIYTKLKKMSDYYNFSERTLLDTTADIKDKGISNTWRSRKMWNEMRMSDADISDVTAYTYTYLMNGSTPDDNWTGLFKNGERIRLRFINGSAMTFFDVRIPGLKMTVVAADGQYVKPVTVDEFRIGIAETYDVIIEPDDDSAYTVFAQSIDRSGYTRATLTSDPDIFSVVPELDPAPTLTHADMGMGGMTMANMNTKQSMDHTKMDMSAPVMDHSMMDHSTMDHSAMPMANTVTHSTTEYGPHVDERANNPQYRLDDPGVGLRNNGRRVLTYADLRNLHNTTNDPEPTREINLHLTGNMSRYMWSINGVKYSEAKPIELNYGERVRINFVNDTMMNHPMHLHGMWSDLETGDNDYMPRKHTIIVQPGSRISYRVTADAKGKWAFHCHLLYHMGGMFREVHVS